jgi:hypothetical protein
VHCFEQGSLACEYLGVHGRGVPPHLKLFFHDSGKNNLPHLMLDTAMHSGVGFAFSRQLSVDTPRLLCTTRPRFYLVFGLATYECKQDFVGALFSISESICILIGSVSH